MEIEPITCFELGIEITPFVRVTWTALAGILEQAESPTDSGIGFVLIASTMTVER